MSETSSKRYVVRAETWAWNVYQQQPAKLMASLSVEFPDADHNARILADKLNAERQDEATPPHKCVSQATAEDRGALSQEA